MWDSLFHERSLNIKKILTEQLYVSMNILITKYKPMKVRKSEQVQSA